MLLDSAGIGEAHPEFSQSICYGTEQQGVGWKEAKHCDYSEWVTLASLLSMICISTVCDLG